MDYGDIREFYRTQLGVKKENSLNLLAENTTFRHHSKGEQLVTVGDSQTILYILLKGVARAYVIDDNGNECVVGFSDALGGLSFGTPIIQEKMNYSIDAVTDLDTLELPVSVALYAMRNDTEVAQMYHRMLLDAHNANHEWQVARQTKKGKERYRWFMEEYKTIASRVQQKDIASFLGIQPPSLSRIKSQLK